MTLHVLLIEDSPSDAKLIIQELRKTGRAVECERVEDAEAMWAALERRAWDLVISDWSMPRFTAPAALGILKEKNLDLPFIIVSGTIADDLAVVAMRAGAHDYVLKDKLGRLAPAVERELRECKDRRARREAETALVESETRFRRLADAGIIGIVIADSSRKIVDVNQTFCNTVGYSRAELVSGARTLTDMTPSEFTHRTDRARQQLESDGVAPAWEMEAIRKDGVRVPILAGAAILDFSRTIAFTVDLTQRKLAEQETARLAGEAMKEQAGRRRAEEALSRSEEQLRQAQKMEAVGRLAGGVAHDFNNVLSVILSYGELILSDLRPADPLRRDIEEIRKAAARAAGLTRQLLLFSRQQVVEARVLDLNEILTSMDRMLQRILGEDVELVTLTARAIGRVSADPSHIEQVILNLVVNARDAMPTGGKLTIETANVDLDDAYALRHLPARAGPHVMLAVSDTGCGIDKATQARIFEPFFTTKEKGKGTGLGLSTVFGIVHQSGGNIWVYSEPNRGTTFKIYLPRVAAELDSVRIQVAPATLRGTERILVVEDEDQVREIVINVLRRQGYQVMSAQNGGEALLHCEKYSGWIDLLLTDVVMPQMSGPELARRLAVTRPEMKVLCMSGYTDDSIVRHGVLETGVAYIQKPLTPASLATKVREVLDEDPATTEFEPVPEGNQ
jgi:two-component system, cell cycle sensor histidine kinase and response regulator CckA